MKEHNFEIGDVVTMKAPFKAVYEGTISEVYKQGIKVHFFCGDRVYISNYMLYTLTNVTKQQKATQDNQSTTSEQESKEQPMKEHNFTPKNIKPEDEVTITTTYRELATVYAIYGSVNGAGNSYLFKKLENMLDYNRKVYDKVIGNKTKEQILNYNQYQKEFETLLFSQEPVETDQQKQIRELREQAEAMLQQVKALEENQK